MEKTQGRPHRRLFLGVVGLMVFIEVVAVIRGLTAGADNPLLIAAFAGFLALISIQIPLFAALLLLSIWGYWKYPERRRLYGLVSVLTAIWLPYAIYRWTTLVLP